MKKTLVLGSLGFIGSALCERLNAKGIPHRAIPTSSRGMTLDRDAGWLASEIEGADTVYLCAGRTGGVGRMATDPLSFVLPNVRIHMNVFEACREAGVRRIICGQSITGYPSTAMRVDEDDYHDGSLHPAYFVPGNTWRFIDRLAEMMKPLEVVFLRPSNVYGPRNDFDPQTSHVIEATVRKVYERQDPFIVWGSGMEKRDPTYIDDLAEALTLARECPPGAYNIGTGQSVSVADMVGILCAHASFHPRIEYDRTKPTAIPTRYLSCDKASQALGFEPKVSIEEGLCATYDWYASNASPHAS
jgi:nucleoside-diphosphate-sugar epimerase